MSNTVTRYSYVCDMLVQCVKGPERATKRERSTETTPRFVLIELRPRRSLSRTVDTKVLPIPSSNCLDLDLVA
jgi:hypothetical protein